MKLSDKAQRALDAVVAKFQAGDLSPVIEVARLERVPGSQVPSENWSFTNRVMALFQTGSLDCRGYRQWQAVGRQVKKGSSAAYILAPVYTGAGPLQATVTDEETGEKSKVLYGFKTIPVFAYHDTEGDPLPEVNYTPRELPPLADVALRLGVEVVWEPLPPDRLGACSVDGERIRLDTHDASVFFHELAHACHARLNGGLKKGQHAGQETVAEFTAAVLMHLYGLGDRTGNAWHYIEDYAKDPLKAIVKALSTVEKVLSLLGIA